MTRRSTKLSLGVLLLAVLNLNGGTGLDGRTLNPSDCSGQGTALNLPTEMNPTDWIEARIPATPQVRSPFKRKPL